MGVDFITQRLRARYDRIIIAQSFGRSDRGCMQMMISTPRNKSYKFARVTVTLGDRDIPTLSLDRRLPLHTVHIPKGDPPPYAANPRLETCSIFIDDFLCLRTSLGPVGHHGPCSEGQIRQEGVSLMGKLLQGVFKIRVAQQAAVAIDLGSFDCSTTPVAVCPLLLR